MHDTPTPSPSSPPRQGGHRCGWVALVGPVNAGKSSLVNALVGEKVSIVTPKAQTTRNQIVGILTEPGAQIVFQDTPGLHEEPGALNRLMVQSIWEAVHGADVELLVLDADHAIRRPGHLENDLAQLGRALGGGERPLVIACNKVDLFKDKSKLLPLMERLTDRWPAAEVAPVSAETGEGLTRLRAIIKERLPEREAEFPDDQLSTSPLRFMAAEAIREKLFTHLREELPYSVAVDIEHWEEEEKLDRIHAVIYVGRKNHKSMVIGKQGKMLKLVGTEARKDIEALTGRQAHLELWVKVRDSWADDAAFLRTLGFRAE